MPSTILVNGLGLTYKGTIGVTIATLPDVCKTPTPGGPVPIPYPNFADQSSLDNGSTTVKAHGNMIAIKGSEYSMSSGDEAGNVGGVTSNTFKKESAWITYSFDVKIDGENACRHTDKMFQNHKNCANLAGNVDPAVAQAAADDIKCAIKKCDEKNAGGQYYDVSHVKPAARCAVLGTFKHTCVKQTLEAKNPNCQCERTFDMRNTPPTTPPTSVPPAGWARRPDVVLGGPSPADYDVFDAKFPCDKQKVRSSTGPASMPSTTQSGAFMMSSSQFNAYDTIANGGWVTSWSPEDCKSEVCD